MKLLFDDDLAPITSTIGFLETGVGSAVSSFEFWQKPLWERSGSQLVKKTVLGDLRTVLLSLLPLNTVERRRFLFIPTHSKWVAYVENGMHGTDAVAPMSYLAEKVGCRGLRVTAVPNTRRREGNKTIGRYGATVLEIYGAKHTYFLNYIRTISALNDGGHWSFHVGGTPQPFENLDSYKAKRIKDRFAPELLQKYLEIMGLHPFEESFYLPKGRAILIEKIGTLYPQTKEITLEEARARY